MVDKLFILIGNHLNALSKYLDLYSTTYEKVIEAGIEGKHMKSFCGNYNLKRMIKQPP